LGHEVQLSLPIPLQYSDNLSPPQKDRSYKPSLFNCNLVSIEKQLYLIENESDFGTQVLKVLKASGKDKGQIAIHEIGPIGDVIPELRREAHQNYVLDFDKRSKGTLLETVEPREA